MCGFNRTGGAGFFFVGFKPVLSPPQPRSGDLLGAVEMDFNSTPPVVCNYFGVGTYKAQAADGTWTALLSPKQSDCPKALFGDISWV